MRVVHCCLAAFYIDNYGYQENILPKVHQLQGHDVYIIASTENYLESKKLGYSEPKTYKTPEGIPITRLPYSGWWPMKNKIRKYRGLIEKLEEFKPDLIFLHDAQFFSVFDIIAYKKKNPNVIINVDCHTDLINSGRGFISKEILHKIIYRFFIKKLEPYVEQFFGVLPLREKFLIDIYGVDEHKVKLLRLGLDDTEFDMSQKEQVRLQKRQLLNIDNDDFVLISGGKIDERKKTHHLIRAWQKVGKKNIKLILFGMPDPEMEPLIDELIRQSPEIIYLGWQSPNEISSLLCVSDLAIFPGTHSVIWEQVVGLQIPSVFRKWPMIDHLDIGGNCLFIDDYSEENLTNLILSLASDKDRYNKMKLAATSLDSEEFLYTRIAKTAIGQTK